MKPMYAVIMAGGGGTRLWPVSRQARPKQTLNLFGGKSLFQVAVDRIEPLIPPERIFVVTVAEQARLLKPQAPEIPADNFILEPGPRGTASVVGLAATILHEKDPDAVMAVLTADHFIGDVVRFRELLSAAALLAQEGDLVTLGITPDRAEVGYGYIQKGEARGSFGGLDAYQVHSFKEKPTREVAVAYLESGEYVWNSGMFVWRADRILAEIDRQMVELAAALRKIRASLGSDQEQAVISAEWDRLVSETIDYGVMEHAEHVSVIPADDLGWIDVGGWNRFFELYDQDASGNVVLAEDVILADSARSLVFQETDQRRLIALLGVEDLVIVDVGDIMFVGNREQTERVRELVQILKEQGRAGLL